MVVLTLEIFYVDLPSKNFGVGIEPTSTSKAGGAPFAFPLLDLIVFSYKSIASMKYHTAF